jgi:eukaryotic-like serine/threonine-protein kinase
VLNHPNIVAVYDFGEHEGSPYIVSELLQGNTLRDRMASGTLGARKAVEYGIQIAQGLVAAHEKGIVHRDLKPENLFLTRDGLVKILDFGIAKLAHAGAEAAGTEAETLSNTSPGTILGTVGYMSPEQVRGLAADHRSDFFSFGAVLYELVTGQRAFRGSSPADTLSAILREDPTDGLATGPGLPAGLLALVRRCLEKAPDDRFQTARDLVFALRTTSADTAPASPTKLRASLNRRAIGVAPFVVLLAAACALAAWLGRRSAPLASPPTFERLTFRIGVVDAARFAPDGETILYAARWGKSPFEIFSTRQSGGARPLGVSDALILSVSRREEMALLLRPRSNTWSAFEGTLATAPLAGGSPRELLEGVRGADWSPDGTKLAVIHVVGGERHRIEYPIANVVYEAEPPTWMDGLRVSPDGDRISFLEHPVTNDRRGRISVVGRGTKPRALTAVFSAVNEPSWSPDGREIRYAATRGGGTPQQIRAVTLDGQDRLVWEAAGGFILLDAGHDGRAIGTRPTTWTETRARGRGAKEEAELPAADLSFLADLSDDGTTILGTDIGNGGGPNFRFYVQSTDGSAPVWLGEGDAQSLSPDRRQVLAVLRHTKPEQLVIVPTRAGEARPLERGPVVEYRRAVWDNSGKRVVFAGVDVKGEERVYVQGASSGSPLQVSPELASLPMMGRPVSPDGERVIVIGSEGLPAIQAFRGGAPSPLPGLGELDLPLCWTRDGRELIVARYEDAPTPPRIERVEVATGRARTMPTLTRSAPSGLGSQYRILVTPDGESYAYSYQRRMDELYISSKLW